MPPNTLQVHTEYVLVKSVVPCLNCGGGDRWCRHLSSIRGISPSSFVLSPIWCSRPRPTTCVLLAPCHDEIRGPRSDYVRQNKMKLPCIAFILTNQKRLSQKPYDSRNQGRLKAWVNWAPGPGPQQRWDPRLVLYYVLAAS
ncbi:uncharacterized protein TNCV_4312931 [Trichonephila clavipes]|nr:uncharacterized protein TNCV_4312931 [Trichonephila clavipes]